MTEYVVFIPGNEAEWEASTQEKRDAAYARHREFAERLAAGGHRVTAGAELTHSAAGKVVRAEGDSGTVGDGPYFDTADQITGFYVIESDDHDGLLEIVGHLAGAEGAIEVRGCVDHSSG